MITEIIIIIVLALLIIVINIIQRKEIDQLYRDFNESQDDQAAFMEFILEKGLYDDYSEWVERYDEHK